MFFVISASRTFLSFFLALETMPHVLFHLSRINCFSSSFLMNWVHVVLGMVAGMVYSIFGWLKNAKEAREMARLVEELGREETRGEAAKGIFKYLYENRDLIMGALADFDARQFLETVLQGLVIGLFIGLLNMPVDVAASIAMQTGILTLVRKLAKIIKP